jgi:ribonucleotide reductase beta subunit family protein with ferritin-like domain
MNKDEIIKWKIKDMSEGTMFYVGMEDFPFHYYFKKNEKMPYFCECLMMCPSKVLPGIHYSTATQLKMSWELFRRFVKHYEIQMLILENHQAKKVFMDYYKYFHTTRKQKEN